MVLTIRGESPIIKLYVSLMPPPNHHSPANEADQSFRACTRISIVSAYLISCKADLPRMILTVCGTSNVIRPEVAIRISAWLQ